jgi:ABC-type polysaccharide/polyol phosphate transport system ATPase subunit
MTPDLIIDRVSKRYRVRRPIDTSAAGGRSFRRFLPARSEEFWALRDVSFEVPRGETLGIIGNNGAGKSTLLKLLSNVTTPTSGRLTIHGRLSALIEVGSGFHPELTGRENVYLSGSILGMRRREITEKLERIVEFAGVHDFIDTPVKRYSSGMYLRLGFSIAAHLEPDILLLDEVLAVGDAAFQVKCLDRISELHRQGRTIIFISHDLAAVERLCNRVLLLRRGQIVASGPARDVIAEYQTGGSRYSETEARKQAEAIRSREVEITSVACVGADGRPASSLQTASPARFRVSYLTHTPVDDAIIDIHMYSLVDGTYGTVAQLTTGGRTPSGRPLAAGAGSIEFEVDHLACLPGMYFVDALIVRPDQATGTAIDWQHQCLTVRVDQGPPIIGSFYQPHRWRVLAAADGSTAPATVASPGVPAPQGTRTLSARTTA